MIPRPISSKPGRGRSVPHSENAFSFQLSILASRKNG